MATINPTKVDQTLHRSLNVETWVWKNVTPIDTLTPVNASGARARSISVGVGGAFDMNQATVSFLGTHELDEIESERDYVFLHETDPATALAITEPDVKEVLESPNLIKPIVIPDPMGGGDVLDIYVRLTY